MGLLTVSLASGVGVSLHAPAFAAPPLKAPAAAPTEKSVPSDDLPNPFEEKRRELREQAVSDVVSGRTKVEKRGASTVAKVGETTGAGFAGTQAKAKAGATAASGNPTTDQYVELKRETTDRIFVILAEFGDERHPSFPDKDTDPTTAGPTTFAGPLHNQIPEPNRAVDNSTVWQPDYSADYFRKLYFGNGKNVESVKTYYQTQSSGRYSVDGEVTDWVKVRYNEARYGRSDDDPTDANGDDPAVCASSTCNNTWQLVRDAANQWVLDQRALGRTPQQIADDMKSFDQWDRYDFDGDGNFNEPDGYIDHFQIVHSGGDQADGDPHQGEDAIWSHRWYAFGTDAGRTGPTGNLLGGTQIGDTGVWIGDYTIQPENGGLSVFVHEYGHDLGLPDDYDTTGAGDNSVEHWSLMAQSRLGAKNDEGIGQRPGDIGAWQKLQLGWLDYEVLVPGQSRTLTLGPQEFNSDLPQAAVVVLPKKEVTHDLGAPFAGTKQYFSGNADDLDNTLTRSFDLTGKTAAALSLKGRYAIEEGYDYLYFETSTDGGATWTARDGTINGTPFPRDASNTPAIDGSSNGAWVDINVPLTAVAGQNVLFRFHYRTDGGVSEGGFFGDNLTVTADGAAIFTDGAETPAGWNADGWSVVGSSITDLYDNYYIAGYRSYTSYDKYLKTGPYFFGYQNTKPDYVDHYAYQEGLLISYWDTSQVDNNTSDHPGEGRNLYVDAHPAPIYNLTGAPWRARVQVYDAPFSLDRADSFTLHVNGQAQYIRGQDAEPTFNDTKKYWYAELPNHGVKLPAAGVKIKVLERLIVGDGTAMKVRFN
ncbi:immune inhibitor A domain-containing protein [Micromonospora sp. NPDC049559]|uniref:immune inhibitor A domain-containing protein n=1 Tax=Micromonospora sp. NPDC049559 TaxID=3155923 RepID=UPI003413C8B7